MRFEAAYGVSDGVLELVEGAVEGELVAACELAHGNGLQIRHAGFEQAALVVATLAAVRIAHVNFDARNAIAEAIEKVANRVCQALFDIRAETYVIIVIDLNLHADLVRLTTRPKVPGAHAESLG
jgi:hypothetical protein